MTSSNATSSFSCFVNVSDDSISTTAWIVDHPNDPDYDTVGNGYAIAVIASLLLLIGLPWNILVVCIIIRDHLYSQPTLMLLLNLTITNLLLEVIVLPLNIISGFAGEFIFGANDQVRCQVCQIGIVVVILPLVSLHTCMLMSVDRFIYLKRPLKYSSIVTPVRMLFAIFLVWLIGICMSLPLLFAFGEIQFSFAVAACVPLLVGETFLVPNFYYVLLVVGEVIFPLTILFVMYGWILCIAKKYLKHKYSVKEEYHKKQLQLVKVFGLVFTANIITWMPMVVLGIIATPVVSLNGGLPTVLYTLAYLSYLSETVIHPILKVIFVHEIRSVLTRLNIWCVSGGADIT